MAYIGSVISTHFHPLALVTLVIIVGRMVSTVHGNRDVCEDNLSPCGNDCNERCQAKYGGFDEQPQGTCHPEMPPGGMCTCDYYCGPPLSPDASKRSCTAALGLCGEECFNDCCNAKCGSQYNQGVGICEGIAPLICMCHYECNVI